MSLMARAGFGLLAPFLKRIDPEKAQHLSLHLFSLLPRRPPPARPLLEQSLMGLHFPNPLGIAAGFDKNARIPDRILSCGFGFAEVGTITPHPQKGNPRPRILRLKDENAAINRMGFPNVGMEKVRANLIKRKMAGSVVGVNIGPNAQSADRISDYARMARFFIPHASYLALNISSPNTPHLRDLQKADALAKILERIDEAAQEIEGERMPLLLKLSPDLEKSQLEEIVDLSLEKKVSGFIATNSSAALAKRRAPQEEGGLSGAPLAALSNRVIGELYGFTQGRIPIIGVGGCDGAEDAYQKILCGANLLQLYTALTYEGPKIVPAILHGLEARLARDGYSHIGEAVGADFRA